MLHTLSHPAPGDRMRPTGGEPQLTEQVPMETMVRDVLEAISRPAEKAVGLPGAAFHDPAFLALENERLFARCWVAAASLSDIPEAGDAVPVEVAGLPIVILRDRDGEIRAFHNVCRHRAMTVVSEPCKGLQALRCPWHSWTYGLDGRLAATPNLGGIGKPEAEGFDKNDLGLKPVRAGTWLGIVFLNLDGQADTLESHVAPLRERYAAFDFDCLRHGDTTERVFEANWKLTIEGGIEDYHLPWVHPQAVNGDVVWTPGTEWVDDRYVGVTGKIDYDDPDRTPVTDVRRKTQLPHFPGLPDDVDVNGGFICQFPNLGVGVFHDHVVTTIFTPRGPEQTHARKDYLFVGDAADDPALSEAREQVIAGWITIGDQDKPIVEEVHRNHRTRGRAGIDTMFSPFWEGAVQHFQKFIAGYLAR